MDNSAQEHPIFGPVIYAYTRAQAPEDGVLIDVSKTANEAGFKYPVAVTARVWDELITPDDRARPMGQSEEGRLWDVLMVLRFEVKRRVGVQLRRPDLISFSLLAIMKQAQRRIIRLKAQCGPGDNGEPVLTIMFPEED